MSTVCGIECDGCGRTVVERQIDRRSPSANAVRDQMKGGETGWHVTRGWYTGMSGLEYPYKRDICPTCWEEGRR